MSDLLTSREAQEMLKVDRTTVYRMLKDGRLKGVKVGHRWRFDRHELEAILAGRLENEPTTSPPAKSPQANVLPLDSLQVIQDVCAEIAEMGALTTDPDGFPLTEVSHSHAFCQLIRQSPAGQKGCVDSWRKLSHQTQEAPAFITCHAGLQCARGQIMVNGRYIANLVAGQFYTHPPEQAEIDGRIQYLARQYDLDEAALAAAHQEIPVLDENKREKIQKWLEKVSQTFSRIGDERANMSGRLQRIAALSNVE